MFRGLYILIIMQAVMLVYMQAIKNIASYLNTAREAASQGYNKTFYCQAQYYQIFINQFSATVINNHLNKQILEKK